MRSLSPGFQVAKALAAHIGTAGTMTATAVNATGYDRVKYVIQTGAATNTATLDCKLSECATTGGSYSNIAASALTQVADTGGGTMHIIDWPVNAAKPFQKLVLVTGTAAFVNSAIAILYGGSHGVPTQNATQEIVG
jgi:hypothetical protein